MRFKQLSSCVTEIGFSLILTTVKTFLVYNCTKNTRVQDLQREATLCEEPRVAREQQAHTDEGKHFSTNPYMSLQKPLE